MTATPPLRTLLVLPAGNLGGAERWLLSLLDATDRLELSAFVLADGEVVAALADRGVPVHVAPTGRRAVDGLAPARQLWRQLREQRPDVVLANGVKAAALALPVAALTGTPAVWGKHDVSFDETLARPLTRLATAVVVSDPSVAVATGRGDAVVVLPPAPAQPAAARTDARERRGLTDGQLVLGMLGRVVDYKGADDAVRALTRPEAAGWSLLVIGVDDPAAPGESERLAALASELGVADRVRLAGAVADAPQLLSGLDALAVLTKPVPGARTPGAEGFGMSALEAMRAGVPVVAVAGSPPAERLQGVAGVVVAPGDPAAVAGALQALGDADRRAAMASAALRLSADHPDAATGAARLVQALAEAAGRPGAGLRRPPVSVVTTVRDEGAAVDDLLAALTPQLGPDDEVVVVDGGSRDDTVERVSSVSSADGRVRLVEAPGAGISAGRNIGVRAARHPVVACTDAGCGPTVHWLDALGAAFAEPDPPALVTGVYRVTARPGNHWEAALAAAGYPDPEEARRRTPLRRLYTRLFGRAYAADLPTGRSVAFSRAAWDHASGFPEDLPTGEDVTFGRRVVEAGGRAVLAVDAEVSWAQRPTLSANLHMFSRYGYGDGLSGSRLLVGRNLVRAVAYPAGVALLARRGTARRLAVAGAAAYLGLPLARALRTDPVAVPLVPVAAAGRDVAKAWGCLRGVLERRRR